jgi:hypothetical protein
LQIDTTKEDRPVEKRRKGAEADRAESEAGEAKAQEFTGQLMALRGASAYLPEMTDVVPFIKMINPKATEADIAALTPVFSGMLEQSKRKLADDKSVVEQGMLRDKAEAFQSQMAGQGLLAQITSNVSDFVARSPDPVSAIAAIDAGWPGDDPQSKAVRAAARAASGKRLDPGEVALQKGIADQIGAALQTRSSLEEQLAKPLGGVFTTEKTARAKVEKEIDSVNKRIEKLQEELNTMMRKSTSKAKETGGPLGIEAQAVPVVTTKAAYDKLPSGASFREAEGGPIFRKP